MNLKQEIQKPSTAQNAVSLHVIGPIVPLAHVNPENVRFGVESHQTHVYIAVGAKRFVNVRLLWTVHPLLDCHLHNAVFFGERSESVTPRR
jgi:hypothetical protein